MDPREDDKNALAEEQSSLRAEIDRSGQVLEELEGELRRVDEDVRALTNEGPRYEALARACAALEELEQADAAQLFWGDAAAADESASRLGAARQRIDRFEAELGSLNERRRKIADKVGDQNQLLEHLDYSLTEVIEEEEERKAEWLIERGESNLPFHRQVMPWARGFEEDNRFIRTLAASVLLCLLGGLIVQLVDLPIPERAQLTEVPERVAKLVQEIRRPPPAEAVEPVQPEPEEPEPEEPEPVLADEPVPELSEEPAPQVAEAEPQSTKERVKAKGILAFRDNFADRANARTDTRLGSQARVSSGGEQAVGRPTRSMVSTDAPGSSGGINLADLSRDVAGGGGGELAGVRVTQVASRIGGGGTVDRPLSGGPSAGRTDEEIQIVFDRYKAALYRLYNRELRKDPTLRGQLVLKLTIEPNGSVSFCGLESSELGAPELSQQIVDRVSTFDFGAKEDILAMTIIYPIDFLPSA